MTRRELACALLLFGVALSLRGGWVVHCWRQQGAELEFPDEQLHWELARNLTEAGELVSDDGRYAARMPLYPLFLAMFSGEGLNGVLAARLAQAVLAAASVMVAYALARAALGWRGALVTGLLVCCDPYAIFFTNLLLSEGVFVLIGLGLTACAWGAATNASRAARVGVALLGPAAILTRPAALGWVAAIWVVLWIADRNRRRGTLWLLAHVVVLGACLLPWGLRNRAVIGGYAWLSANGGVTLYDGQGPQADGSSNQAFLHTQPAVYREDEIARDDTLRQRALEQMRADPARVLRLAWVKFLRTWNFVPNVDVYRQGVTALLSAAFTGITLVLALVGVARTFVRHGARGAPADAAVPTPALFHLLLWLPVVYFTLVHCVYVGSVRYRVPLMPLLALAAGAAFIAGRRSTTGNKVGAAGPV